MSFSLTHGTRPLSRSIEEACYDDGHLMSPTQWYTALSAYMYKRRSEMNPLWNSHVVAGVDKKTGERYRNDCPVLVR